MHGSDTIYGDQPHTTTNESDGHDIVFGQRGDDVIHGGGGDDELIGEVGADRIHGGQGHDIILGDNGEIMRDFINPQTPRVNENGMWHRDLVLQDHGTVTAAVPSYETPSLEVSRSLVEADMILVAGGVDGLDVPLRVSGHWSTTQFLVDIHEADDDTLQGGDGDDVIVGQRGHDVIDGDAGADYLVGDQARHQASTSLQLPLVFDGLRLFGGESAGLVLTDAGSFVLPPINLEPEQAAMNELYSISRGYGNVLSHEVDEAVALMGGGVLWNASTGGIGTGWLPVASIVPEFAGRSHVLPGNDVISGGPGSDFVIGERYRTAGGVAGIVVNGD
jgi:Ca2+-binding RTX toxin-like protein